MGRNPCFLAKIGGIMTRKDRDELIDRLIANKFSFSYNKDDNTICIRQGGQMETTDNAIGYHYVGFVDEFSYNIGSEPIEEIIADAFVRYSDLLSYYIDKKLGETFKDMDNAISLT